MGGTREVECNEKFAELVVEACDKMGFEVVAKVSGREIEEVWEVTGMKLYITF